MLRAFGTSSLFFLLVGGSGLGGGRAHALASACGRPVGWGPRAEGTPTQGVPPARTHLFLASEIARPPPRPEPQVAQHDGREDYASRAHKRFRAARRWVTRRKDCRASVARVYVAESLDQRASRSTLMVVAGRVWVAGRFRSRRRGGYEAWARLGLACPRLVGPTRLFGRRPTRAYEASRPHPPRNQAPTSPHPGPHSAQESTPGNAAKFSRARFVD